jgi:hypothetical protein
MTKRLLYLVLLFVSFNLSAQDYFFGKQQPFDPKIPSPEAFLGYKIGEQHTRHDLMVAYFYKLAEVSDRAEIEVYGYTHERRKLVMLRISTPENLQNLESIKSQHLEFVNPSSNAKNYNDVPVFIQLGYNVHGNEPSGGEAALLTAYTLVASNSQEVQNYLQNSVVFVDPVINPDGRDRHTQWANQYKANPLVSDSQDAEHNEMWPRGRTNHYWFDLNRDWLLAVHPESQGKLKWYHDWYPNVVTDFHEMGTNSHYFFEPMKPIGSQDPIMPKENYEDLNNLFATYYAEALDNIGSLYYTKESFDGTYPGYGSSYPDLQGALALLFEQASSRGHLQDTDYGKISFPFTIRNQYESSMATIKAAVENKVTLRKYQQKFFKSAVTKKTKSGFVAYEFGDAHDHNRNKAFVEFLLKHKIRVYKKGDKFIAPLRQPQHRMVQTMFEEYSKYRDSVFYDASAWSVTNFYNMQARGLKSVRLGEEITSTENWKKPIKVTKSEYAYLIDWDDYNAPAALNYLQQKGVRASVAFKPFTAKTNAGERSFNYGAIMIPVHKQALSAGQIFRLVLEVQQKFNVPIYSTSTGFSLKGIDLGSNNFEKIHKPKVAMLIGDGVSSYEAGEVWHLLDTRVHMPISKLQMRSFRRASLDKYNTLVMVSGSYSQLDSLQVKRIKDWVSKGNTLVTIGRASQWAISKKLVKETLTQKPKPKKGEKSLPVKRLPFVDASENSGRERLGGAIFEVDLDVTHPLGFGYRTSKLPIYKNNRVFLQPSKNPYSTVAKYTADPHIDGFISEKNLNVYLKPSASLLVSRVGGGRVVLFADNPNFRGAWYGTNKLFLNALFFGNLIYVPN